MNPLILLKTLLKNLEETLAGIFICITTVIVILNVILRYFFNTGLYWSEEVATTTFVWSIFLGGVAVFKEKKHLGVDLVINMLPKNIQIYATTLTSLMLVIINGYISYLSVIFVKHSYIKPTPVLGISSAYISSALLVSFSLMTIYSIIFLLQSTETISSPKKE